MRKAGPAKCASPTVRALFARAYSLGFNNEQLATELNICTLTLCRWKSGETSPTMIDCEAFAQIVSMDIVVYTLSHQMIGARR